MNSLGQGTDPPSTEKPVRMSCRKRCVIDNCDSTGPWNRTKYTFTKQIQTYLDFLMTNPKGFEGYTFHLYVNESATLSSTIETLHRMGIIHVHTFKWP